MQRDNVPELAASAPVCDATYSPDDNKLRLYPFERFDRLTYDRVKAAGFVWAPRQETFVAPMWTPAREDLARELAGSIGDEDVSLQDRAEDRAERFERYSDKRASEAHAAHRQVQDIAARIEPGQPILVGHHSERRARKDASRIEAGMRRAVAAWDTSEYWTRRAAGALRHAKHKELPAVRARRIKTIEADQRKAQRDRDLSAALLRAWDTVLDADATSIKRNDGEPTTATERALFISNRDHVSQCFPLALFPRVAPASQYEGSMSLWSALKDDVIGPDVARDIAMHHHRGVIEQCDRWLSHYANRLTYERAMQEEGGGAPGDRWDIQTGGRVLCRGSWVTVLRVNRTGGRITSVSTNARYGRVCGIEDVTDYQAPSADEAAAAAEATKRAPLCNYPGPNFVHITRARWDAIGDGYRCTRDIAATDDTKRHRVRHVIACLVVDGIKDPNQRHGLVPVYVTDLKTTQAPGACAAPRGARGPWTKDEAPAPVAADTPAGPAAEPSASSTAVPAPQSDPFALVAEPTSASAAAAVIAPPEIADPGAELARLRAVNEARAARDAAAAPFHAMRQALRTGVQVVAAPQLFPTPVALARHVADLADVRPGMRVLEPSAGTGRLLGALGGRMFPPSRDPIPRGAFVHAVEIDGRLCRSLREEFPKTAVHCEDFLAIDGPAAFVGSGAPGQGPEPLGLFDRIVMNPPFGNGADVRHVMHALRFLGPGGRLVAIVAAGPRQRAALAELGTWEDLPAGTFAEEGTSVRTALITIDR